MNGWDMETLNSTSETPPVIVNPDAMLAELADWARGQLEQSTNLLDILAMAPAEGVNHWRAYGAIRHFNLQALAVLRELSERLQASHV